MVSLKISCSSTCTSIRAQLGESLRQGRSLPRQTKSRLSTFAFGASFFGAMTAGCGTPFTVGTDFFRSLFLATVAQVLLIGRTCMAGICMLLTSGALGMGSPGEEGGQVVWMPGLWPYIAQWRRVGRLSWSLRIVCLTRWSKFMGEHSPTVLMRSEEVWTILQSRGGRRLVEEFPQQFQLT